MEDAKNNENADKQGPRTSSPAEKPLAQVPPPPPAQA